MVTGTGNPDAVVRSAREAGFEPVTASRYRDHHWFTPAEAEREARAAGTGALLVTRKDAVRWPVREGARGPLVLEVGWAWVAGGEAIEERVFGEAGGRV